MPITAIPSFSQLSRNMRGQDSVSSDAISGLELAYLRDSVDGFDNNRSAVDDYNETMQEAKSFFVLPDYQKPAPSTAGTTINASYSATSLASGPDPYAYTPPNPVTGEGANKTFINPNPVGKEASSSTSKNDNKTSDSQIDKNATPTSNSRIPVDGGNSDSTEANATSNNQTEYDTPNTLQAQEQTTDSVSPKEQVSTSQGEASGIQSTEVRNPNEALTTLDKPNLHTEERHQQSLKPFDPKSAETTSSQMSGDKGSPATPSEQANPNPVSDSEPISPSANAGTTTFYPNGESTFTPTSPFSNPSEAYYRDSTSTETTTPNYKKSEPPSEDVQRNATIRAKEFWQGVGQGAKSLISLPGLSIVAGSILVGAIFPWAVPFLTIAGIGFGLFYVVGGMASDDWAMVGRGAFNLLGSAIFGKVMSDIVPIGGHDGLRYALPGRSVEPLRFYPADPFGHVNHWYVSGVNQPYYVWGGSRISGSAAPVPPPGMSYEDMEFATPSDLMLAASNANHHDSDGNKDAADKAHDTPLPVAAGSDRDSSNPFSIYTTSDQSELNKSDNDNADSSSEANDSQSDSGWYADLSYGVDSSDSGSSGSFGDNSTADGSDDSSGSSSSDGGSSDGGGESA